MLKYFNNFWKKEHEIGLIKGKLKKEGLYINKKLSELRKQDNILSNSP